MKKIISLAVVSAILGVGHLGVQSVVESSIVSNLEERLTEVSASSQQKVEYTYDSVYFDYLTMKATMDKLQLHIGGTPGVASLLVDKFENDPFSKASIMTGVTAISSASQEGALTMADAKKITITGDQKEGQQNWSNFGVSFEGLDVSHKIYSQFVSLTAEPLIEQLFENEGLDFSFKIEREQELVFADLLVNKNNMFSASLSAKYSIEQEYVQGSFIDPDTGKPLAVGAKGGATSHLFNEINFSLEDKGVRDKVFAWGAGLSTEPGVDDTEKFKEGLVRGTDSYINQVIPYHFLPMSVMTSFVNFIDSGKAIDVSIKMAKPVKDNALLEHVAGHGDKSVFKDAIVEVR